MKRAMIPAFVASLLFTASASDSLTVTAVNKLPIARHVQTIELKAAQFAPLGETNLNKIHVKDAAGKEMPVQAVDTDFDEYHTPDIIVFQSDFAPSETRTFTVTAGKVQVYKPEDYKAYGRFVRERFDDFAWENDVTAHQFSSHGPVRESVRVRAARVMEVCVKHRPGTSCKRHGVRRGNCV